MAPLGWGPVPRLGGARGPARGCPASGEGQGDLGTRAPLGGPAGVGPGAPAGWSLVTPLGGARGVVSAPPSVRCPLLALLGGPAWRYPVAPLGAPPDGVRGHRSGASGDPPGLCPASGGAPKDPWQGPKVPPVTPRGTPL